VPQAAAGVITELREEIGRVAARDNLALQERTVLLEKLGALLQALQQASGDQRAAIDRMVESASALMEQASARFVQSLDAHAAQAGEVATQVAASAVDLASLAEGFGQGVQQFQASSEQLAETLQRVEAAIGKSTARSDEQLAYYVAQAREVIDLSIASQQGLVENLRQLQARPAKPAAAVPEEARA
jgi:ABC-type transporter Mla subunit MlaD